MGTTGYAVGYRVRDFHTGNDFGHHMHLYALTNRRDNIHRAKNKYKYSITSIIV